MAQPNYPPTSPPIYPPVSQSTPNPQDQPSYPAIPQPTSPPAPKPAHPPMSQPIRTDAPKSSCPPGSQPNHTPVPQQNFPAVPVPVPQPSHTAITSPIPVLGAQYCLPHLVDLAIVRKVMTLTDHFVVTDINQNVIFQVKGKMFSLHDNRVLLDAAGNPMVTLRHKIRTAHSRWQVFKGESTDPNDLLFNVKTSSVIQLKTKLNVYLANRTAEDVCDFKVEGSWSERSCVIYVGETNTIAAQMHKKGSAQSFFLGKDTFMVTVYPNVDYAFVVSLIVILDAINAVEN